MDDRVGGYRNVGDGKDGGKNLVTKLIIFY